MANITLEELIDQLRPKSIYNVAHKEFTNIKIDSRKIKRGNIFIALIGEKYDAHTFIRNAFNAGAYLAITQRSVEYPHILVDNTFSALKKLAEYTLIKSQATSIAVTGSTGKTTTKDLVCHILRYKRCHKTKNNENNFIGVSKTLLDIGNNRICVVEVGTNHMGEVAQISEFFKPDIAVFTNIGSSHLEHFHSLDNILKEKLSLLSNTTYPVYNYDDLRLREALKDKDGLSCSIINPEADIYIDSLKKREITVSYRGQRKITVKQPEDVNIYNVLLAISATLAYDDKISEETINTNLANFKCQNLRMQKEKLNKTDFILDCYNANPDSMKYAISVLSTKNGKKLAVLGDMLELGNYTEKMHREIGAFISNFDIDLVAFGKNAVYIYEEAKKQGLKALMFSDKKSVIHYLQKEYLKYDTVLIKGSRFMEMEHIFYNLREKENQ